MLRLMGYEVVSGSEPDEWDVLWTHEYSLMNDRYIGAIRKAKSHQIVNHVAGSGYYTSKVSLALSLASKDTLRAFQLPRQKESLLSFAQSNPHMLWVQKDNTHRNIRIRKLEEMDLNKENSFVQQFVDKPLLIDNRKFDIGVYTVVTSIHPLRVYTYAGDVLLRFCSKNYTPFDISDVDKYVVGDDYTPIWEIPSLKRHFIDQKLGWKGALDAYLTLKGMDPQRIWKRIDHLIAEVFQGQQAKMLHALKSVPSKARFFELSRFDFMVDVDLNVHLLEVAFLTSIS
ncbi:Tubulin-tyrosine ligase family protein [Ancylostoma caninum]|uniref:Tubulin-tyrosine ligase family protein n=1 Tax=Ancylostoma caninum TaxID=29170 RepID=A0A368FSR3_ANCCA|nr:Tubulin-tyrosine ligase family protein [Ancylostoma caninum]